MRSFYASKNKASSKRLSTIYVSPFQPPFLQGLRHGDKAKIKKKRKSGLKRNEKNSFSKTKINLRRTENQSQPNNFSISAERFFILRKNFLRIQILVKQIFMCFLKNIQPLRHEKMDGHIRIQMQKTPHPPVFKACGISQYGCIRKT